MLATEPTQTAPEKTPTGALQETWSANEKMRHIPTVEWMVRRADVHLRGTIRHLTDAYTRMAADDPRRSAFESGLNAVVRSLDRVADVAKHSRHNGGNGDIQHRIESALEHAVANLRSLDADLIGRRFPFQTFERSKAEPLYGALLQAMWAVDRLLPLGRDVDPGLDERLLGGLVALQNPVDDRMLRPIA
ncbi:MAG TPA: hypothetical protein VF057_13590 [Thermoanaerobaculia bacterium]